jgi:hypothetical protein
LVASTSRPTGFTAWFVEMTYPNPTGGKYPLKLTTGSSGHPGRSSLPGLEESATRQPADDDNGRRAEAQ